MHIALQWLNSRAESSQLTAHLQVLIEQGEARTDKTCAAAAGRFMIACHTDGLFAFSKGSLPPLFEERKDHVENALSVLFVAPVLEAAIVTSRERCKDTCQTTVSPLFLMPKTRRRGLPLPPCLQGFCVSAI